MKKGAAQQLDEADEVRAARAGSRPSQLIQVFDGPIGDRPVREQWTADDAGGFGRQVYEAIPAPERARWAADLLARCTIVLEPMPAVEAVVAIGQKETKGDWYAAHAAFQKVRALTLAEERAPERNQMLRLLLAVAETAAKVIYNESGGDAPFDFHAGWRMAPRLRALVEEARDPELEERIWRRLLSRV